MKAENDVELEATLSSQLDAMMDSFLDVQKMLFTVKRYHPHAAQFDLDRLTQMENQFEEMLAEITKVNNLFKAVLDRNMEVVRNCLTSEQKRILYLKNLVTKSQKYEYAAILRGLEKHLLEFLNTVIPADNASAKD